MKSTPKCSKQHPSLLSCQHALFALETLPSRGCHWFSGGATDLAHRIADSFNLKAFTGMGVGSLRRLKEANRTAISCADLHLHLHLFFCMYLYTHFQRIRTNTKFVHISTSIPHVYTYHKDLYSHDNFKCQFPELQVTGVRPGLVPLLLPSEAWTRIPCSQVHRRILLADDIHGALNAKVYQPSPEW